MSLTGHLGRSVTWQRPQLGAVRGLAVGPDQRQTTRAFAPRLVSLAGA
jgi:hypothetical protein